MNLEYLRTYLEVVKRGSFSEAARRLGLTQPGVTLQVQRLERDLGVTLLDRKEGGVSMTGAGEEFYRFAADVLSQKERLEERLQGLSGEVGGRLTLGASTVPGEYVLPRLLADFTRLHPGVEASVEIGDTDTIADRLMRSEFDLAFLGAAVDRRGLRREKFLDDELVLIVPASHPFAGRKQVGLAELEGERLISREQGSGTMQSARQLLQKAGFDPRRWQHAPVFGSTQAMVSAVEAGLGVAFVSAFAAQKSLECGLIAALRIEGVPLKRELYITYLEHHLTTRLQQEFLAFSLAWAGRHQTLDSLERMKKVDKKTQDRQPERRRGRAIHGAATSDFIGRYVAEAKALYGESALPVIEVRKAMDEAMGSKTLSEIVLTMRRERY